MRLALAEAAAAGQQTRDAEDIPVGAVIVDEAGTVIARARNRREIDRDPTAHAEIAPSSISSSPRSAKIDRSPAGSTWSMSSSSGTPISRKSSTCSASG